VKPISPARLRAKPAGAILLTAVAAAALGLPLVSGAAAATPAAASAWPATLTRPAAVTCPRGETLIAPTGGYTDAMGVSHVTFKAAPGMTAMVPPRGLTAARVTNAMAADIGLHVKTWASASYRRQFVQRVLNLSRNRTAPEFCRTKPDAAMLKSAFLQRGRATPAHEAASGSPLKNTFYDTPIWGGTTVTEAEYGTGINGAQGSWHVADGTTAPAASGESTWVGIGGGEGNNSSTKGLIQTGTQVLTGEGYRSWYEAIGTSGCTDTSAFCGSYSSTNAVHNSDSVFGEVTWESSSSGCFYFVDNSRSSGSYDICTPLNIPYDHTSAEWVNENYIEDGLDYNNPHTVTWQNQYLSAGFSFAGPWKGAFAGSAASLVMGEGSAPTGSTNNCSNTSILSYPANISETSSSGGTSQILTCYRSNIEGP
jgi:Peptidase A4 family